MSIRLRCLAVLTLLLCARTAAAQNVGTIAGRVVDAQGLNIPGATVTATNRVSGASQSAVSDNEGRYTLGNLAFGTYVVAAALPGFVAPEQIVDLRSTVPVTRPITMTIGGIAETVTVSAAA